MILPTTPFDRLRANGINQSSLKYLSSLRPLRLCERKKSNSPRRKARIGASYKNKSNIEVLGDLGAFARKKQINSRQGAKNAKVLWVRTD